MKISDKETIRLQCKALKILAKDRLRGGDKTVHDDIMQAVSTIEGLSIDALRYLYLRSLESRDSHHNTRSCLGVSLVDWAKNIDKQERTNFWGQAAIAGKEMDKRVDYAMRRFANAERKGK